MLPMTNPHVAAGGGVVGADAVEEEPILAVGAMLAAPSEAPHHEVMAEDHDVTPRFWTTGQEEQER